MREIKNLDALELSESLLDTYKCAYSGQTDHQIRSKSTTQSG
jgi:hypothetical protein